MRVQRSMVDMKNIITTKNGEYIIRKTFNGHKYYYGTYKELPIAIQIRDELREDDWNKKNLIHHILKAKVEYNDTTELIQQYNPEIINKLFMIQCWTDCEIIPSTNILTLKWYYTPTHLVMLRVKEYLKPELKTLNTCIRMDGGMTISLIQET